MPSTTTAPHRTAPHHRSTKVGHLAAYLPLLPQGPPLPPRQPPLHIPTGGKTRHKQQWGDEGGEGGGGRREGSGASEAQPAKGDEGPSDGGEPRARGSKLCDGKRHVGGVSRRGEQLLQSPEGTR